MTVDQILDVLRSRVKNYEDPGAYMEEEWYIKCAAKVDVLSEIEYRIARGE